MRTSCLAASAYHAEPIAAKASTTAKPATLPASGSRRLGQWHGSFQKQVCHEHGRQREVAEAVKRGAVREMKDVGPSEPPFGGRLQTALCCVSRRLSW